MTKRIQLKEHINTLDEIGSIMKAMKNLSLIEINKLTHLISNQANIVAEVTKIGHDFLLFYPDFLSRFESKPPALYILMGSERGLCGNFNERLLRFYDDMGMNDSKSDRKIIVVGRKLAMKMTGDPRVVLSIAGPNSTEEISEVAESLLHALEQMSANTQLKLQPWNWMILYNEEENNTIQIKQMQPFMEFRQKKSTDILIPPLLNVTQETFLFEFIQHYLFSTLYSILYQSFFSENYQRLRHLDSSLEKMDKTLTSLNHKFNLLCQEEITQEIQVIMLSAASVMDDFFKKDGAS